ncbi:histidine kinase N-terminal 7TM domain-containing diguanylate cyclase [Cellulomonas sp. URHB0016]
MPDPHTLHAVMVGVYALALVAALALVVGAWLRRRTTVAAWGLMVAMIGVAVWTAADLIVPLTAADPGRWGSLPELCFSVVVVGAAIAMAGFWMLARSLSDRDWKPTRRTWALLAVHPLVMVVLIPVNHATGMVLSVAPRTSETLWPATHLGPGFWAHTLFSYVVFGWAGALVVRTLREGSPLQRRQAASLLLAAAIPTVPNLISIFAPPGSVPELTAIAFTMTGAIDSYALFRQGLLTLLPVARTLVLDRLSDAVVVLDPDGRLLDVNASGERLIRALAPDLPQQLVGVRGSDVLAGRGRQGPLADGTYDVVLPSGKTVLDVRVDPLLDRRGSLVARVVVVRDVTEVHRQRDALDRLRADLAEQAVRDELTGLHNRRFLIQALDRAVEHAHLAGEDLWALILDIDHFKSVNDQHGHPVGDDLLAHIAGAITATFRSEDVVARYGGEEFVVLLPRVDRTQALARADAVRRRCQAVSVHSEHGPVSRTVSVGAASLHQVALTMGGLGTAEGLLRAADWALYAAKREGRDRAVSASDMVPITADRTA